MDSSKLDAQTKARQERLTKMAKRSKADEANAVAAHHRRNEMGGCLAVAFFVVAVFFVLVRLGGSVLKSNRSSGIASGVTPNDLASVEIVGAPSWKITYTNKSDGVLKEISYRCMFATGSGGQTKTVTTRYELVYPLPPGQSDTSPFRYHSGSGGLDLDVAEPRGCEVTGAKFFPEPKEFAYSTALDGGNVSMRISNLTDHNVNLSKLSLQCVYRLDRSMKDIAQYGGVDKSDYTTGEEKDVTGRQDGKFDYGIAVPANGSSNVLLYYGTGGVRAELPRESGSSDVGGDKYYYCFFQEGPFAKRAINPLRTLSGAPAQLPAPATSASAAAPQTATPTSAPTDSPPVTTTPATPSPQGQSAEQPGASSTIPTGEPAVAANPPPQPQTSTPPPGSSERRAIMEAIRPQAEQIVGQPVIFRVISLNVVQGGGVNAYTVVQPLGQRERRPIGGQLQGHLYLDEQGWKVLSLEPVR